MFLKVLNTQVNDKEKTSKKTNLRNLVVSSQYILKDMKRFIEAKKLELKKMMVQTIQLS
tara:strand:+ start:1685 stop:1861 length:177 start_codon:yes stop_codon:yes gene_type:complete